MEIIKMMGSLMGVAMIVTGMLDPQGVPPDWNIIGYILVWGYIYSR